MKKLDETERQNIGKSLKILIGRLIDGTGAPEKRNILMTIEKGRIADMRPFLQGETPLWELWRDFSDCTVLPPLMDCHVHMSISGSVGHGRQPNRSIQEYDLVEPIISQHVQDCRRNGVLGARDGGDSAGYTLRYKISALNTRENGFRLNAAGNAWHREGRYGKLIGRAVPVGQDPATIIKGEGRLEVDHIKLIQSGLNSLTDFGKQTPPQFDETAIRRIYELSRKMGVDLMVHANGEVPVATAIAGGCDSIEHGYFMGDENLRKMADAQIIWVPTAVPMKAYADHLPKDGIEFDVARRTLDHQLEQLSKARQYGVTVALGTDAGSPGVEHGKAVWDELKLFMDAGFSVGEAIRCATFNASQLTRDEFPGHIGIGTPATFIVLKGEYSDILEQPAKIEMMMVEGRNITTSAL